VILAKNASRQKLLRFLERIPLSKKRSIRNFTILVVDDEKNTREGLRWALENSDTYVLTASNGIEALELLREHPVDLMITDLRMPELDGLELLRRIKAERPEVSVIILTGHGTVENAVDAMKEGAVDYLLKPVNLDELQMRVERARQQKSLERENLDLRERVDQLYAFENIVGRSPAMLEVFEKVRLVAPTRANVLIYGESGTGKELIANAIHQNSPRRNKPFVKVNCGALPLTLLESELFGHDKGAFTGAINTRRGRFELADGGTLFLDEISETAPEFQVKLLRVLQEGEFERVGGTQTIKVDVRIIAATNKRLDELVRQGKFREDLYYRLKVVEIDLPPLRERPEDIPLLVEYFLEEFSRYYGKPKPRVHPAVLTALQNYHWPGNVRQLRNVLEGAFVMAAGEITLKHLPPEIHSEQSKDNYVRLPLTSSLEDAERLLIQAALTYNQGNRAKTARQLGIGRKTLYRKMTQYGIE
jgi:DNA-binding NtrC family response regulator